MKWWFLPGSEDYDDYFFDFKVFIPLSTTAQQLQQFLSE